MKVTKCITIDPAILKEAEKQAKKQRRSFSGYVEFVLSEKLKKKI